VTATSPDLDASTFKELSISLSFSPTLCDWYSESGESVKSTTSTSRWMTNRSDPGREEVERPMRRILGIAPNVSRDRPDPDRAVAAKDEDRPVALKERIADASRRPPHHVYNRLEILSAWLGSIGPPGDDRQIPEIAHGETGASERLDESGTAERGRRPLLADAAGARPRGSPMTASFRVTALAPLSCCPFTRERPPRRSPHRKVANIGSHG
jgi:hypothetical protein